MSHTRSRAATARCAAGLAMTLLLTGCAFEREWQAAQTYAYPEHELAGCWEGTWQSDWNGHQGGLRAIITKAGAGAYHAQFKATYATVIPFEFDIPLLVTDDGSIYTFESDADLGWLAGGLYNYTGTASGSDFHASFRASNCDHGTFSMQKLQTCVQHCGLAGTAYFDSLSGSSDRTTESADFNRSATTSRIPQQSAAASRVQH